MYPTSTKRKIEADYCCGLGSLSALAAKYGVRRVNTAYRWAREGGWARKRAEMVTEAADKSREDLTLAIAAHNQEVVDLWGRMTDAILARLENAEALDARDLASLALVLEKLQRGQRIALGADVPGEEGPSKVIVEYQGLAVSIAGGGGGGAGQEGATDASGA